jgi:hypothetical protein
MDAVQIKVEHQHREDFGHEEIVAGNCHAYRRAVMVDVVVQRDEQRSPHQKGSEDQPVPAETIGAEAQYQADPQSIDAGLPYERLVHKISRQPFFLRISLVEKAPAQPLEDAGRNKKYKYRGNFEPVDPAKNIKEVINRRTKP